MRILAIIHNFPPAHRAGSETYALHLATALRAESPDIAVSVISTDTRPHEAPYAVRRYELDGMEVYEINQPQDHIRFSDSFSDRFIERHVATRIEVFRPDVVHIHHLMHLSAGIVGIIPPDAARVMHLHDYWLSCPRGGLRMDASGGLCGQIDPQKCARCIAGEYADISAPGRLAERWESLAPIPVEAASLAGGGSVRRLIRAAVTRMGPPAGLPPKYNPEAVRSDLALRRTALTEAAAGIDRFIAPSRFLRDEMIRWGLPESRIIYSDYGFQSPRETVAHSRGGPFTIGFAGTLAPHKGAHVLIEAFRNLFGRTRSPVALRIFGNRSHFPSYVRMLDSLARGLPVEWAGPFDDAGRDAAYRSLDVLVVPSLWWENSPLTIHEAWQRGVPAVVSDLGGMRELVTDETLRFPAGDATALAGRLVHLAVDRPLVDRLARSAPPVKSIMDDARWTLGLYEELVSARRRS
ncbi:MAG: glycosyltransferase [Deltaproteobacteria bacterium]|nr:glycosyltransferase [Deltaproteobacteria bacterium]